MSAAIRSPKGHFLFGNLAEFNRDTFKFLLKIREYGAFARFRFGPFPVFVANSPETLHQVLVEHASKFYKSRVNKQVLEPLAGNGLFTSDGDFWKRQRKLMQPVFHAKRIADYGALMVEYTDQTLKGWQPGETRDLDREMTNLTMRIIAKTLFDADVTNNALTIGQAIARGFQLAEVNFKRLLPIPPWMPGKFNRDMRATVRTLDSIIQGFIEDRRRTGVDKGDLLSLLLAARDDENQGMSDKQVRDEAMTLFGAGHETTAVTLMWAWYLLSQNPDVEAKLHAELDQVLGGRLPTLEDLPNLPYTEMVIKETMRLYPAAWAVLREAVEAVEIGGYPVPARSGVLLNIYGIHHDPKYYPDPERFYPERFRPEAEKQLPKYAYVPFGGGPRICIGNAFASMEARLVLATVAQRFSLALAAGHVVETERLFTLRAKYGMKMVLKARR